MKLNFKDPIYWLVILALGFFLWGQCQENKVKDLKLEMANDEHNRRVSAKNATIQAVSDSLLLERRTRAQDSVQNLRVTTGLKQANTAIAHKLALARPNIQPYLDSLEAVGSFVVLQDSALSLKDSLIVTLEGQIDTLRQSYNRERRLLERQTLETTELVSLWEGQAKNYEAMFRKADRKASRKFTVGPYFGYGVSSGGLSPSFGVSVQYRLLRF